MPKLILQIILALIGIYVLICVLLYLNQEKFIFDPSKIAKDYQFNYERPFKELYFTTSDSLKIHALYFETENPKGVVYYLHGNSGNLSGWGDIADVYLDLGYNILLIDYRGFGKSEGKIENQKHFYEDAQLGYNFLKENFNENQIIMIGYSVGTGTASHLASANNPKLLILQSPYFNLDEIMKIRVPFAPTFLLKYKFENNLYIPKTKCPVYIFHGEEDAVISYTNSLKLKEVLNEKDQFITLKNQGHNGINENPEYLKKLEVILDDQILESENPIK